MVVYICIKNIWKKNKKLLAVVTSWGGWKLDRNLIKVERDFSLYAFIYILTFEPQVIYPKT